MTDWLAEAEGCKERLDRTPWWLPFRRRIHRQAFLICVGQMHRQELEAIASAKEDES